MQRYILGGNFYFDDKIVIDDCEETEKLLKRKPDYTYRKTHLLYIPVTNEKIELVKEYNKILKESREKLKQLKDKIFE